MKSVKKSARVRKQRKEEKRAFGNLKSILAIFFGILIALLGFLIPRAFFIREEEVLIGRQYTVDVLSSDSVHTVTRDTSFSLEDYAYITEMTRQGSLYYSEPSDAQLSMREASIATGEILKALLPDVFVGSVNQPYSLSSAILTSNVQSSEADYDFRQSFWYVDISYPDDGDDLTVSSTINAVNGKAWSVAATFPLCSFYEKSYGIQIADFILDTWEIPSNLFYTDASSIALADQTELYLTNTNTSEEEETATSDDRFRAEYLTDDGVLIYNASDFYEHLGYSIQTIDGITDFMTDLYHKYLDYLEIDAEDAEPDFSVEVIYDEDLWYNRALEDCRELLSGQDEINVAAGENYLFAKMYGNDDVDTILLDSDAYEEALALMSLVEYPDPYYLNAALVATDKVTDLSVTVTLQILCDEEFTISVSLGMDDRIK